MSIQPLIDAETIASRVAELGRQITCDYLGQDLTLAVVLKGSFVFAADLARHIDLDVSIDFLGAVDIDYLGFTIEDVFVVGYGLDHAQKFRNLPFLALVTGPGE